MLIHIICYFLLLVKLYNDKKYVNLSVEQTNTDHGPNIFTWLSHEFGRCILALSQGYIIQYMGE